MSNNAGASLTLANMNVRVMGDLDALDKAFSDAVKRAERAGRQTGQAFTAATRAPMKTAGQRAADDMLTGLERQLKSRQARTSEQLARGIITKEDAARQGREAARAFDAGLLRGMDRLGQRGQLTRGIHTQLGSQFKNVGAEAAEAADTATPSINKMIRAFMGLAAVTSTIYAVSRALGFLRGTITDAEALAKSYLKLNAAAKLFGVDQKDLQTLAEDTRVAYRLTTTAANELAVQTTKLTARAGDASQAQKVLAAALDLGAAQGMDAQQVAMALEQTLRGLDEGTDKLFQKNPSDIYAEYSKQIKVAVGAMTEQQKKQALVNETLIQGGKVAGAYNEFLKSNIGSLATWRQQVMVARETIGSTFIPVINQLGQAFAGPLASGVRTVVGLLEMFLDPAERAINRLQRMGTSIETMAPLLARQGIVQGRENITRLRRDLGREAVRLDRSTSEGSPFSGIPSEDELATRIRMEEDLARKGDAGAAARLESLRAMQTILRAITAEQNAINKAESDLRGLDERAAKSDEILDIEREIADLKKVDNVSANAAIVALEARKAVLEKELGRIGDNVVTKVTPPEDPEAEKARKKAIEQAKDLVEQWRVLQLMDIEKQVEQWKEYEKAARAVGNTGAEAAIRRQRIELEKQVPTLDRVTNLIRTMVTAGDPNAVKGPSTSRLLIGRAFGAQTVQKVALPASDLMRSAMEQMEGDIAGAREELMRGLISNKEFESREAAAIKRFNGRIFRLLDALRATGKIGTEEFDAIQKAIKDVEPETADLAKTMGSIAAGARGVLDLADAFGVLTEETQAALEGVAGVAEGVARIATGDVIGGSIQAAGALFKLGSAIFGESAEDRERKERLRENTQAINRLTLEMAGFRMTGSTISGARGMLGKFQELRTGRPTSQAIGMALGQAGMTMAQLDAIASEMGITIRDKEGRLTRDGLNKLAEALGLAEQALTGFRNTVADQTEMMDLQNDIYDETITEADKLKQAIALMTQFAPGIGGGFAGADPNTAAGRAAIEAQVRALFEAFKSGELDLEGLTREEFLELIRAIEGGLDATGEGGVTSTDREKQRLSVNITEVQASQLIALEATQVERLTQIVALLGGGGRQRIDTGVEAPTSSSGGMGGHITVDMTGLTVEISAEGGAGDAPAMMAAGKAAGGALGKEFGDRFNAAWRGVGATGPAKVKVKADGVTK